MAEKLFWAVFEHLGELSPRFVSGTGRKRFAGKFKRLIHPVDSTTVPLIASCMDWAKHRRRKAAAQCHLRLDLQSFLPRFAIVDTARHNDARRAREGCAGIKAGEIVIFDKAYVDFAPLADLCQPLVFWVTRAKDNLSYTVARCYQKGAIGKILRDDLIRLQTPANRRSLSLSGPTGAGLFAGFGMIHSGTASRHRTKCPPCSNLNHLKTPNALFQISLPFPGELSGFIPRLPAYGMPVKSFQEI